MSGWAAGFESEAVLGILILTWVLYELYGRTALEWISGWTTYIRLAGGAAIIFYLWWQARDKPTEFQTTLDFAKQMLKEGAGTYIASATTKEKRNVTGLTKKKVAASQQWKCGHCKATLDETYEVDHIKALFQGGTNDPDNLVALCPNCHRKKTVNERLAS